MQPFSMTPLGPGNNDISASTNTTDHAWTQQHMRAQQLSGVEQLHLPLTDMTERRPRRTWISKKALRWLMIEHAKVETLQRRAPKRCPIPEPEDWLYKRGHVSHEMTIVLTGVVMLYVGRDAFQQEAGAFTVLGLDALAPEAHYTGPICAPPLPASGNNTASDGMGGGAMMGGDGGTGDPRASSHQKPERTASYNCSYNIVRVDNSTGRQEVVGELEEMEIGERANAVRGTNNINTKQGGYPQSNSEYGYFRPDFSCAIQSETLRVVRIHREAYRIAKELDDRDEIPLLQPALAARLDVAETLRKTFANARPAKPGGYNTKQSVNSYMRKESLKPQDSQEQAQNRTSTNKYTMSP